MALQLIIGNKNYSSWSLRPWLLMQYFEIEFSEFRIPLFTEGSKELLQRFSPHLKVPVLIDEELTIWESLAICEYLNEHYLQDRALPTGREARAICRSYCHEMHAGFPAIRQQLPFNCRARRSLEFGAALRQECRRVDSLWTQARRRFKTQGDFLFGQFSLADCMFAPLVLRFQTYDVPLAPESVAYSQCLRANAAVESWCTAARQEQEVIAQCETGAERSA